MKHLFLKQKIQPVPGLQVNIDGVMGLIKTVSGGRTLVDFNHPLAGKDVVYNVKLNRLINDDKEKLSAYLKIQLGLKDISLEIQDNEVKAKVKREFPSEVNKKIEEKVKELIPNIKKLDLVKENA